VFSDVEKNVKNGTTWLSRHQKGKSDLDLNETRDDGGCSGISAGPYANNLHLAADR